MPHKSTHALPHHTLYSFGRSLTGIPEITCHCSIPSHFQSYPNMARHTQKNPKYPPSKSVIRILLRNQPGRNTNGARGKLPVGVTRGVEVSYTTLVSFPPTPVKSRKLSGVIASLSSSLEVVVLACFAFKWTCLFWCFLTFPYAGKLWPHYRFPGCQGAGVSRMLVRWFIVPHYRPVHGSKSKSQNRSNL